MSTYGGGVVGISFHRIQIPEMAGTTDAGEAIESASPLVTNPTLHCIIHTTALHCMAYELDYLTM